jgi:site-specific DNA-cytosine methylase
MENVPQVHGSKNKEHFDKWIEFLASKGYSNYWQDLNAKDYKIPQSRNRCFMVSILGDYSYDFPVGSPLNITLKDVLENVVDEKYYLSDPQIDRIKNSTYVSASYDRRVTNENGVMSTLLARDYKDPKCVEVCNMAIESGLVVPYDIIDKSYSSARLEEISQGIISTKNGENNQISNTITTSPPNFGVTVPYPNNKTPFITIDDESVNVREATKKGYASAYEGDSINLEQPNSTTRLGRVGKQISHTLTTSPQQAVVEPKVVGGIGEKKSNGGRQWYQQDRIYDDNCAISVTTAFNPYYATHEPRIIREEPLERDGWHEHAKEVLSTEGLCRTLCAQSNNLVTKIKESQSLRIRKLTPKECWRLMGFDDEDFHKAEKVCSNS